jgi:hypothetical protein
MVLRHKCKIAREYACMYDENNDGLLMFMKEDTHVSDSTDCGA